MHLLQASSTSAVDPSFHTLALVMGWTITILVAAFAAVIIFKIILGDKPGGIDLKYLLAGDDHSASLSRFQFLIFTFVIALSLFLLTVNSATPGFPQIPNGILALLGISGGSYVVAKGVDASKTPTTVKTVKESNPDKVTQEVQTAGSLE